jgi:hypothetical protein
MAKNVSITPYIKAFLICYNWSTILGDNSMGQRFLQDMGSLNKFDGKNFA